MPIQIDKKEIDRQTELRRAEIESPNEWLTERDIDEAGAKLAQEDVYQLDGRLRSRWWRLNHMYWIEGEDDDGQRVVMRFKANWAQTAFYHSMWWLCTILKVRQLGFSTFIALFMLDDVLFNPNHKGGIVDKTDADAKKKLAKCRFAYDNLNREDLGNEDLVAIGASIKAARPLVSPTNEHTMSFGGELKGAIWAGTNFRGDTAQVLHISELGYTAHYYPRKAEELMAGATNAVHKGNHIFVESTFEGGKIGEFYDNIMAALENQDKGLEELTTMDYRFYFYTWWKHPEYQLKGASIPTMRAHEARYYENVKKQGILLTRAQVAWHIRKWRANRESMMKEFPTTIADCLNAKVKGAIYADQTAECREQGRLTEIKPDPRYPIYTSWDLGFSDFMCIWVWQIVGPQIRVLQYYENTKKSLGHYVRKLQEWDTMGMRIATHYLPHDAAAHSRAGRTFEEEMHDAGIDNIVTVPVTPDVWVGINTLRDLFGNMWFDKQTEYTWRHESKHYLGGFLSLEAYVQAEDSSSGAIRPVPVKNQATHGSDGLRTMAEAYARGLIVEAPAGRAQTKANRKKPTVKMDGRPDGKPAGSSGRRGSSGKKPKVHRR